jgi:hypothetical protein
VQRNKPLKHGQFALAQHPRPVTGIDRNPETRDTCGMVLGRKLFGSRKPETADAAATGTRIRITNPWHAVSVECGRQGCPSAQRVVGQRFLSGQAPKLPLVSCANPMGCRCVYKHHDDRRAGPRRLLDDARSTLRSSAAYLGEERRNARGRRSTDG